MVQRPRLDLRGGCAAMRIPTVTGGRGSVTTPPRPKLPRFHQKNRQISPILGTWTGSRLVYLNHRVRALSSA